MSALFFSHFEKTCYVALVTGTVFFPLLASLDFSQGVKETLDKETELHIPRPSVRGLGPHPATAVRGLGSFPCPARLSWTPGGAVVVLGGCAERVMYTAVTQ